MNKTCFDLLNYALFTLKSYKLYFLSSSKTQEFRIVNKNI